MRQPLEINMQYYRADQPPQRAVPKLDAVNSFDICLNLLTVSVLLLGACAPHAAVRTTELDPIEFKVDRPKGEQPQVFIRDFEALSQQGLGHFQAGQWAEALRLFQIAIREFPKESGVFALEYNAGLCEQKLGHGPQAAALFQQAMQRSLGTRNARDCLFEWAESLEMAKDWLGAAQLLKSALDDPTVQTQIGGALGVLDALEATARMGIDFRQGGDLPKADEAFKRVDRIYRDKRDLSTVADSEWVVRSLYERGEIYRELFANIRFRLPVDRMKRDLEDKANLFLKSENAYFQCVRIHHKHWSLAAGYEIGHLYQQLIDDIDHAEVPPNLAEDTLEIYRDELWNHTEHLAKRAVTIYQKNIELATRLGEKDSDWVQKSAAGKVRMEKAIEVNTARRLWIATKGAPILRPRPTPQADVPLPEGATSTVDPPPEQPKKP